jgi:arsenite transporter
LWVVFCIIIGIIFGRLISGIAEFLNTLQVYQISLPIAICLFFMIYPIMVQIDFKKVIEAGKNTKNLLRSPWL